MLFHSTEFLFVFLPIVWLVFRGLALGHCYRLAITWLTLSSLVFYGYWNPPYLILILTSIFINYGVGTAISPGEGGATTRWRKPLFLFGLIFNLGALAYFKYANFFVDNVNFALGTNFDIGKVILPLAISFFTFQKIAYLVDCYRSESRRYALWEYGFFVAFFPQLIAGPIVQHRDIIPQVENRNGLKFSGIDLTVGITIFILGMFKKMVLADGCAVYATPVFDAAHAGVSIGFLEAWIGSLAYGFQLYFDFSGYSDMAIGLARMFGFILPINFDSPYKAASIVDFWRRWHITLSRFLRNYLYFSLGGNRKGVLMRYRNLLITMLLGGLWHGAAWTFVIWGGLHGLYLVINHGWKETRLARWIGDHLPPVVVTLAGWFLTFLATTIAWVFFRASDLPSAWSILTSMAGDAASFSSSAGLGDHFEGAGKYFWLLFVAAISFGLPNTRQYLSAYEPSNGPDARMPLHPSKYVWSPKLVHGLLIGVMLFFILRRYFVLAPTEFLYFHF